MKAASSAEHMKVLAVETSNADSFFQQLDKLRMVYEEYVKIGEETIPNAEKDLHELTEELDQKSQALDDVITNSGRYCLYSLTNFCAKHVICALFIIIQPPNKNIYLYNCIFLDA